MLLFADLYLQLSTENLLTEIELLKNLKHPHIVELKDITVSSNFLKV